MDGDVYVTDTYSFDSTADEKFTGTYRDGREEEVYTGLLGSRTDASDIMENTMVYPAGNSTVSVKYIANDRRVKKKR